MLVGEKQPETLAERAVASGLLLAFLTPWMLMGAGSFLVGLLALGPGRNDSPELWICLPAGAALLLGVALVLYWAFWRVPRLTISRFEFDGDSLTVTTGMHGTVSRAIGELRSVVEERRRGRGGLRGWWLRFHGGGRSYLSRFTANAEELVRQIGPKVGYNPAR